MTEKEILKKIKKLEEAVNELYMEVGHWLINPMTESAKNLCKENLTQDDLCKVKPKECEHVYKGDALGSNGICINCGFNVHTGILSKLPNERINHETNRN